MDFCPQLSAFQGVIISADNVHPFSRLTTRGGNEEKIEFIVNSIKNFLTDAGYITNDGINQESIVKLRKFAFFLILNADFAVLSDMTDMEEIELVIWTIPTIPKCLLCEIFWRLNFDTFVYELIAFCDPDLASEIASAFIDNMKYYTPSANLKKIRIITTALNKLLCRIYFFNYYSNNLTNKLNMVYNHFTKVLSYFIEPPRKDWLNSISNDDLYRYKGECVNTMLLLIRECMEEYTTMQDLTAVSDPIYMLTYIGNVTRNVAFKTCDCPTTEILSRVEKAQQEILDTFKKIVKGISINIFCAWSEYDQDGKSMQKRIGELCYKVRNMLTEMYTVCSHSVVEMMRQISVTPANVHDLVNALDADAIIENINNSEDKAEWIQALFKTPKFYEDESLIECAISHIHIFNQRECYDIFERVSDYMIEYPEHIPELDTIIVKVFQGCDNISKQKIMEVIFSDHDFFDMRITEEFYDMMTEIFNKLISTPDADFTDILSVFIQSPQKVYEKIFTLAAENMQQTNIMLKAMAILDKYSNHYYSTDTEPCIIRVAEKAFDNLNTEAKQHNFIKFMCALKNTNSITGTKLLMLIIMPRIHKALLKRDTVSLNVQCRLLKEAYTLEELMPYRAPMLAMLGQILDVVRWKINTFEGLAPETVDLALDLQTLIMDSYGPRLPENDLSWLKSRLRFLKHELNVYYYRKLWDPPGNNLVEILSGYTINSEVDMEDLVTWLSQAICSCTQKEWSILWDSLCSLGDSQALDILHNAVSLITLAERPNRMENTWPCVMYLYRNFVYTIRYKFFKEPLTNTQVENVLDKIIVTSNVVDEGSMEELSSVLIPLFAYLSDRKSDYTYDIGTYLKNKCKSSKLTDILTSVFSNDTV